MRFSYFSAVRAMRWMGIISASIVAAPLFLNLPARAQGTSPRDLLQSGVDAYIKSGPSAAFSAWSKGGVTEGNNQMRLKFETLKQLDAAYGTLEGSDIILDLNVGTRVQFVYFVLYYGKCTAYGYIEAFRLKSGGWVIADLNINTKPQEVIPEALLPRKSPWRHSMDVYSYSLVDISSLKKSGKIYIRSEEDSSVQAKCDCRNGCPLRYNAFEQSHGVDRARQRSAAPPIAPCRPLMSSVDMSESVSNKNGTLYR